MASFISDEIKMISAGGSITWVITSRVMVPNVKMYRSDLMYWVLE